MFILYYASSEHFFFKADVFTPGGGAGGGLDMGKDWWFDNGVRALVGCFQSAVFQEGTVLTGLILIYYKKKATWST